MKNAFVVFVVALLAFAFSGEACSGDIRGLKLNQSIVGLLASEPSLDENVREIASAVDHTDGLRVRPIIGCGSLQSVDDLLFLRGVGVTLPSPDSLAFVKQNKLYKDETGPANSDEFIAAELVFGVLGANCERAPTTGEDLLAALLNGRVDAAVFTDADAYALLNSISAKSGQAFSVQAAVSQ